MVKLGDSSGLPGLTYVKKQVISTALLILAEPGKGAGLLGSAKQVVGWLWAEVIFFFNQPAV